jgi:CRP-like cAMP-binding protein
MRQGLPMNCEQYKPLLMKNPWFAMLPASTIKQLLDLCKLKHIARGEQLLAKDAEADGMYCVLEGKIKISNVNREGKEMVLTWLTAGTWFGEISMFDGLPRTHDSFAESDSQLLMIPSQSFHRLLLAHPELYPHFMKQLCERIRTVFAILDETSGLSLRSQLMKRLVMLSNGWNAASQQDEIQVSQESLARLLNTSRQTINKLLQALQREKLIEVKYGKIKLLEPEALRSQSDL